MTHKIELMYVVLNVYTNYEKSHITLTTSLSYAIIGTLIQKKFLHDFQ